MFRLPVADLPHPHEPKAEADPDERFASIVRRIAEIGRRNDQMREQIVAGQRVIDALVVDAEGDSRET